MSRQFNLEKMNDELIKSYYNENKTKNEIIELGMKIIDEAYKVILEKEILIYHILGTNDYPMNNYKMEQKKILLGEGYERTIFEYRSISDNKLVATIFEQNFFAGYGTEKSKGVYVGIVE